MEPLPPLVEKARVEAAESSFAASCDPEVGRFLAVLAAAVPPSGRVLEIGTGAGVGTAWLAAGAPTGVTIHTIELDHVRSAATTATFTGPEQISFHVGDAVDLLPDLGTFDLVFADAEGGKWYGLESTIQAVRIGGVLVVDDMNPPRWESEVHERMTQAVRKTLLEDERLLSAELGFGSGVVVCTRTQ